MRRPTSAEALHRDAVRRRNVDIWSLVRRGSNAEDRHVRVTGGEEPEVVGVMGGDDAAAEPNRCRSDECVDGHLATGAEVSEKMPGDPGHADPARYDLSEASGEHPVDRLVGAVAAVQLEEHRRRDANRRVAPVGAPHRCLHPLMPERIQVWTTGKRGDRFAVQD